MSPWVIVRDGTVFEHYARLKPGSAVGRVGHMVSLPPLSAGVAQLAAGRAAALER